MTVALTSPASVSEEMANFIMVRVPVAVGDPGCALVRQAVQGGEAATMTDVAVDASTPVGPTVVLDLDGLRRAGPASVPGCEELPGLDHGLPPAPAPAGAGGEGAGSGLGAGKGRHRTHRMQFCCRGRGVVRSGLATEGGTRQQQWEDGGRHHPAAAMAGRVQRPAGGLTPADESSRSPSSPPMMLIACR